MEREDESMNSESGSVYTDNFDRQTGDIFDFPDQIHMTRGDYKFKDQTDYVNNLPEMVSYGSVTPQALGVYKYIENKRYFKPIFYNEGKSLRFTVYSNNFIDPDNFNLTLTISNPNIMNYLQIDGTPHSFIKRLTFIHNGVVLEQINDYNIITNLINDINFDTSVLNNNVSYGNPFTVTGGEDLIPPKETGSHNIFNPPQVDFDYMRCRSIENGKLSFKPRSVKTFEIRLFSYLFGKGSKDYKLIPLFIFNHGLQIEIDLNEYCFFVPVFNAKIQDLINANINNTEYALYRAFMNEHQHSVKMIEQNKNDLLALSTIQKTATTKNNSTIKTVVGIGNCLFSSIAISMFNDVNKARGLQLAAYEYLENNIDIAYSFIIKEEEWSSEYLKKREQKTLSKVRDEIWQGISSHLYLQRAIGDELNVSEKVKTVTISDYINGRKKDGIGGKAEMFAISTIYNTPIELYDGDINFLETINPNMTQQPIKLSFTPDHYNSIISNNESSLFGGLSFIPGEDFFNIDLISKYSEYLLFYPMHNINSLINYKGMQKLIFATRDNMQVKVMKNLLGKLFTKIDDEIINLIKLGRFNEVAGYINKDYFKSVDSYDSIIQLSIGFDSYFDIQNKLFNMRKLNELEGDMTKNFLTGYITKKGNKYDVNNLIDQKYLTDVIKTDTLARFNLIRYLKFIVGDPVKKINSKIDALKAEKTYYEVERAKEIQINNNTSLKKLEKIETDITDLEKNLVDINLKIDTEMANIEKANTDAELRGSIEKIIRQIQSYFNFSIVNTEVTKKFRLLKIDKEMFGKIEMANLLWLMRSRNKLYNDKFLRKLKMIYGAETTFNILEKYIPDLFIPLKEGEIIKYLESENFDKVVGLISHKFITKFKSLDQIKNFNPFELKFKNKKELSTIKKSLLLKMLKDSSKMNLLTFAFTPNNNYIIPLAGLLIKITNQIQEKSDQFIEIKTFSDLFNSRYLNILKMYTMLVKPNNSNPLLGRGMRNVLDAIKVPLVTLMSSVYGDVNFKSQNKIVDSIVALVRTKFDAMAISMNKYSKRTSTLRKFSKKTRISSLLSILDMDTKNLAFYEKIATTYKHGWDPNIAILAAEAQKLYLYRMRITSSMEFVMLHYLNMLFAHSNHDDSNIIAMPFKNIISFIFENSIQFSEDFIALITGKKEITNYSLLIKYIYTNLNKTNVINVVARDMLLLDFYSKSSKKPEITKIKRISDALKKQSDLKKDIDTLTHSYTGTIQAIENTLEVIQVYSEEIKNLRYSLLVNKMNNNQATQETEQKTIKELETKITNIQTENKTNKLVSIEKMKEIEIKQKEFDTNFISLKFNGEEKEIFTKLGYPEITENNYVQVLKYLNEVFPINIDDTNIKLISDKFEDLRKYINTNQITIDDLIPKIDTIFTIISGNIKKPKSNDLFLTVNYNIVDLNQDPLNPNEVFFFDQHMRLYSLTPMTKVIKVYGRKWGTRNGDSFTNNNSQISILIDKIANTCQEALIKQVKPYITTNLEKLFKDDDFKPYLDEMNKSFEESHVGIFGRSFNRFRSIFSTKTFNSITYDKRFISDLVGYTIFILGKLGNSSDASIQPYFKLLQNNITWTMMEKLIIDKFHHTVPYDYFKELFNSEKFYIEYITDSKMSLDIDQWKEVMALIPSIKTENTDIFNIVNYPDYGEYYTIDWEESPIHNMLSVIKISLNEPRKLMLEPDREDEPLIPILINDFNNSLVKLLDYIKNMPMTVIGVGASLISNILHIIEVLVRHLESGLNFLILIEVIPVFSSVIISLSKNRVVSRMDASNLLGVCVKIDNLIVDYNETHGTNFQNIMSGVIDLNNPDTYKDIIETISDNYPSFIQENRLQRQSNFEILNEEANIIQQLDVARNYKIESAYLQLSEFQFDNPAIKAAAITSGYKVSVTKLEIINHTTFNTVPPGRITLSLPYPRIRNMFQIILSNAYLKYPTYRQLNRFSRQMTSYGVEINKVRYPQDFVTGNISSSSDNIQFISNLSKCFNLRLSAMNEFNIGLDTSTSTFVTKKLNGYQDISLFEFDPKTNLHLNLDFGYNNEIIGKSIFGVNFDYLTDKLGWAPDLKNQLVELFLTSNIKEIDSFCLYEMLSIVEYDTHVEISPNGYIR